MCTLNKLSPALTCQNVFVPDSPNPNISKADNDKKKKKVGYDSCPFFWFECEVCPRGDLGPQLGVVLWNCYEVEPCWKISHWLPLPTAPPPPRPDEMQSLYLPAS